MIGIIDELNANEKVGEVRIGLVDDNPINKEIVEMMLSKYQNIYDINISDWNDLIDH